jgi:hypothetical protein
MEMRSLPILALFAGTTLIGVAAAQRGIPPPPPPAPRPPTAEKPVIAYKKHEATAFHTSDRCVACHNGMKTREGEDISIGFDWEASIMANSSRDPYWQASIRRETIDHPESSTFIQNDCSTCHMPAVRLADRDAARDTHVFARFPFQNLTRKSSQLQRTAQDGVTCAVCHQIKSDGLGTEKTYNGNVVIGKAVHEDQRPEYGPFDVDHGHQTIMHSSTGGFLPEEASHIRDSALCGSCHTLITTALGPGGVKLGNFPEQVPFQEWQHSSYNGKRTCQECHMPVVNEPVPITALYGQPREGMHRHVFVGGNFVLLGFLKDHHDDLAAGASPQNLETAIRRTTDFLQTQSAKVTIEHLDHNAGKLSMTVLTQNLTGHKLPTAYPSRRAWLHVVVRDAQGHTVFESGALRPDGSIVGNANDDNPQLYEPHYREITRPDQVEIYEPILGDVHGNVTTGLLNTVRYLKDNRLLPSGFDKETASKEIAVVGDAATDPSFGGGGSELRYVVPTLNASGPFRIEVELWYQPIGFRWAHNLAPYKAAEPQRVVGYYESASRSSAVVLAKTEATQ